MPSIPDAGVGAESSTRPLSQRNLALAAVGLIVAGAIVWRLLGSVATVLPLGAGNPIGTLGAYTAPVDSAASRPGLLPGQSIELPRDPFTASAVYHPAVRHEPALRPRTQIGAGAQAWRVSAVLITNTRRAAVVNDSLVDQGAALPGGARLTSVEADHVIVTDASGTRHTITARDDGAGTGEVNFS